MAPRQTNDEYLASLEAELKATKAKAEETIAAKIAAVQAKLDAAKAKDEERTKSRIVKLDEQIAAAKVSITKAEARLAKLQEERANLIGTTEEPDSNPELVDDERTEQPEATAKGSRRRADAA